MSPFKPPAKIDQSHASAGKAIVARDYNETTNVFAPAPSSIGDLAKALELEIAAEKFYHEKIESLLFYYEHHSHDGVDGLEAKLNKAGRHKEIASALRRKDLFARLMTKYSLFYSAQLLYANLLARAEAAFSCHVEPHLATVEKTELDLLIKQHVVDPIVQEAGANPLEINHAVVSGMIYWPAEQCYIRWHS